MATPMTSLPPLKHFDFDATITLNTEIGRGQCRVYEGTMGGREIAVKKMDCDKGEVPKEVELQHRLSSHPNILPLLGVSHSQNMFTVYILMERADMSLHQYLHTEKRKPASQLSLDWAQQIARGLHHIHQHGLAHRDLKSANVLLFEKENIIKICDFGSAKVLDVTATKTGETGTYRWMAPEFLEKSKKINQRCDMFSYGMILYELYAHEVPYSELKSEYKVASFIIDKKRPSIPSKLPKYLKTLMAQCWEHSAYDRPTSSDILTVLDKGAQFLQATESGDVERVKQMVAEFVDVNTRNEKEETALHIASRRGDLNIVGVLIGAKAGIDLQEKDGRTPLYIASLNGHLPVVELLLKEKADITICRKDGFSPLYVASHGGHTQIVEMLLLKGADPNLTDKDGCTPLYIASLKGHLPVVELLLKEKADITICDKNGCSPLYVASQEGYSQIVDILISKGADPNLTTKDMGSSPLGIASEKGHVQTVKKLLELGAHINHQNKNGSSPLYIASQNGHTQIVELLLKKGADPNLTRTDGTSPLFIASQNGHIQTVELLLRKGADPNLTDTDGTSPLYIASQNGHTQTVELLLRKGADPNLTDTTDLVSPLIMAAEYGHTEVVVKLLSAGAKLNHQNKKGGTALLYASWYGHLEVVRLLLQAGAVDTPAKNGETALSMAIHKDHHAVVTLLKKYLH